jgi:hypothetical protein
MEYTNGKIILLILLMTSFSWLSSSGQKDSVEIRIKEIRKECDRINKDSSKFKVVQEDINDQSAEGGILKKMYDSNTLRKAVLIFFGETGQSTSEYYLLNGEIIFVYQREERYKSPIYMGKTELKSQEENRFYFKNKKLIRWTGNDGKILDAGLYPEKEKEIVDDFKSIH